jgi:hypothetical protein
MVSPIHISFAHGKGQMSSCKGRTQKEGDHLQAGRRSLGKKHRDSTLMFPV